MKKKKKSSTSVVKITKTREEINKMRVPGVPYLPPPPDPNLFKKGISDFLTNDNVVVEKYAYLDLYKNHPLLSYRRQKEKQKEIQEIIKKQALKNRAKALKKNTGINSVGDTMVDQEPVFPQEHYIAQLRKCAEKSPIAPIEKKTLNNITEYLPPKLRLH